MHLMSCGDTGGMWVRLLEQTSEKSRRVEPNCSQADLSSPGKHRREYILIRVPKSRFAQLDVGQSRTFDCGQSTNPLPPSLGLQRSQVKTTITTKAALSTELF